jgi:hypothetical protein
MKKYLILIPVVGLLVAGIFILKPKYSMEQIQSPDSNASITRIDYWTIKEKRTFFVYGDYERKDIPTWKLEPIYFGGLTDGFHLVLEWKNDTACFYAVDGEFADNLPEKITLIKLNGQIESHMQKWIEMKQDSTGKYIQLFQKRF